MSLAVSRELEVLNNIIFKFNEHKRKRHGKVLEEGAIFYHLREVISFSTF